MYTMRAGLVIATLVLAVEAGAQEPTRRARPLPAPPRAPAETPIPQDTPLPAPTPRAAMAPLPMPLPTEAPIPPEAMFRVEPALAPGVPEPIEFQGRGRIRPERPDRAEIARIADEARAIAREQADAVRAQSQVMRAQTQQVREQAMEAARAQVANSIDMARAMAGFSGDWPGLAWSSEAGPPSPWAQGDPADSLYRDAYETMNKGDYRKAAELFRQIPAKFPNSTYAADAMYWTAHALYRVGSTPDLQDALRTLEQLQQKYPNPRLRGSRIAMVALQGSSQNDVAALQVRIAGVLSARGEGGSDIVKRALAQNANVCDAEEQQVRAAALNALMQTDPEAASEYAQKVLARKDDCSRSMRRAAVFLIGGNGDPKAAATLISVARSDPSVEVRGAAIQYLGRIPGDASVNALQQLAQTDTEPRIQRAAIQQLARNADPRARTAIKSLVERNDVSDNLRIAAIDALDPEQSTQDDVAWLQATYSKVNSPRVRSRIISAIARIGGSQNEKWFVTLVNNDSESIEVRVEALRRAGQGMDIAALGRLYDQTGQRQLRFELVRQLERRREAEATDKLGDIAKNGTDVEVRKRAIEALSSRAKTDERASKLLLQLIDRP